MLVSDEENVALLEENEEEENLPPRSLCQRCPFLRLLISPTFLWVIIVVETIGFAAFMAYAAINEEKAPYCAYSPFYLFYPDADYSRPLHLAPVNDAISYNYQSFVGGFNQDLSLFQAPPSKELDQRWRDLYSLGMSRISRYEAAKLPNATVPIPGDEGHYIVELDVFHQLRCLDRIRQTIYSDHYPDARISLGDNQQYASHCIDSIRQSLMCSSDVSLLVWQWDEATQQSRIRNDVVHRCRDFDNVKGWALHRQLKGGFNTSVRAH
ncbi:hypothetical protein PC9H_010937 [Pleurotus ostreatus]|uniref:Tat pathway signal sequence protein n=1 Tax=Pleurotus ostreatus TaxID=5322 RepID=A0A8H6ZPN6_PLEOS|nr:uncharacterized protein PC9H_010937 [Pleurotus ostreatus]KAF7422778.1 hypothetical protein PC9H_010937 [Pleurotus ostreatus]